MTKLNNWLAIIQKYIVNIEREKLSENNYFTTYGFKVSDPIGNGIGFAIFFNDDDRVSLLYIDNFDFPRLNIAEGVTPQQLLECVEAILEGNLYIERGLLSKKQKLVIQTELQKYYSEGFRQDRDIIIEPYQHKRY